MPVNELQVYDSEYIKFIEDVNKHPKRDQILDNLKFRIESNNYLKKIGGNDPYFLRDTISGIREFMALYRDNPSINS